MALATILALLPTAAVWAQTASSTETTTTADPLTVSNEFTTLQTANMAWERDSRYAFNAYVPIITMQTYLLRLGKSIGAATQGADNLSTQARHIKAAVKTTAPDFQTKAAQQAQATTATASEFGINEPGAVSKKSEANIQHNLKSFF